MEESREQQSTPPVPPVQQPFLPAAAATAAPLPPQTPSAQPSRLELGGRIARLLAGRALWSAEQLWRVVQPRAGWLVLTGLLVAVIGVLSLLLVVPRLAASRAAPGDPRVAALAPAPAVEDFLRGQQTYDADLMWASFSQELRQSLEGREITRDTLAERIENERRAGQSYSDYRYIGGIELANRLKMYFYAVEISSPEERGTVSFVFTVGSDGKILRVE